MRPPCVDHDPGDEDSWDEFARWMDADAIGALCKLVRDAGLTMTLHGVPIDEGGLRDAALVSAVERIVEHARPGTSITRGMG